jgi:hypothetical protein
MSDIFRFAASLLNLKEKSINILVSTFDPDQEIKDSFGDWYRGENGKFARGLIYFLCFLSAFNIIATLIRLGLEKDTAIGALGSIKSITSPQNIKGIVYASEAIIATVITLNIIFSRQFSIPRTTNIILQRAFDSSLRFLNYWPLLWGSWFLLYLVLTLVTFGTNKGGSDLLPVINACNSLSGVLIFSMYYELAEKTDGSSQPSKKVWIPAGMVLLILLTLELVLTKKFDPVVEEISYVFSLVSGTILGIATGLLVTKLASRIINLPFWTISFLVFYAVIQPAFPIIAHATTSLQENLTIIIAMLAFYGKVILLIVVHWMRDTDGLSYYMARARRLYDEEEDARLRQIFEVVVKASKNIARWRESGQPWLWVEEHNGQWNHEEWLSLLKTLKDSDFWPMEPDAIGTVLEETKRDWALSRGQ